MMGIVELSYTQGFKHEESGEICLYALVANHYVIFKPDMVRGQVAVNTIGHISNILDILSDSSVGTVRFRCRQLLEQRAESKKE